MDLGYKLSAEEFGARELVDYAVQAEEAGFGFALMSDHFHPWVDAQGESPFVWTVLGAIGRATSRLAVGTAVTCPTIRIHPAIIAQAAATTASLMPGRFFLGVGTGENLNEHVVGQGWPAPDLRLGMLEEAIEVMRLLWKGEQVTHRGRFYSVDRARLYSLPDEPPPVMVAASNPGAVELAGRAGDAMINTEVEPELVESFASSGGKGKPRYVEVTVCVDEDERRARKTAREIWSLAGLQGMLFTELPMPSDFSAATEPVTEDQVAEVIVCGADVQAHLSALEEAEQAGYTHACVHQVGPRQREFFEFYQREVLPQWGRRATSGKRNGRARRAAAGR